MTGPDNLFELAEMPEHEFFEQAAGTLVVLATVAGYHRSIHPSLALALWAQQIAVQLCSAYPLDQWETVCTQMATRLEERAHVE